MSKSRLHLILEEDSSIPTIRDGSPIVLDSEDEGSEESADIQAPKEEFILAPDTMPESHDDTTEGGSTQELTQTLTFVPEDFNPIEELSRASKLIDKIDQYDLEEKDVALRTMREADPQNPEKTKELPLYQGIRAYQDKYHEKVKRYALKKHISAGAYAENIKNHRFFRELYTRFLLQKEQSFKKYMGTDAFRAENPEQANITMTELFGENGKQLYQLALDEEMHSKEYRDAVFQKSIAYREGEKYAERPIIFVGGPSASGKSYAAELALTEASSFLKKESGKTGGNKIVYIDGGIVRDVSQVRKLAITVANNRGFTGISDLHKKSGVLESMKEKVFKHTVQKTDYGMVIPETFSAFRVPFPFKFFTKAYRMLKTALAIKNSRVIFTRVVGTAPSTFQRVVEFLGSMRAWKTKFDKTQSLDSYDLNAPSDKESKEYEKQHFNDGVEGTVQAMKWYQNNSSNVLTMEITNDLILIKRNSVTGEWEKTEDIKDTNAKLISSRVFMEWELSRSEGSLDPFAFEKKHNGMVYVKKAAQNPLVWVLTDDKDKSGKKIPMLAYDAWKGRSGADQALNPFEYQDKYAGSVFITKTASGLTVVDKVQFGENLPSISRLQFEAWKQRSTKDAKLDPVQFGERYKVKDCFRPLIKTSHEVAVDSENLQRLINQVTNLAEKSKTLTKRHVDSGETDQSRIRLKAIIDQVNETDKKDYNQMRILMKNIDLIIEKNQSQLDRESYRLVQRLMVALLPIWGLVKERRKSEFGKGITLFKAAPIQVARGSCGEDIASRDLGNSSPVSVI